MHTLATDSLAQCPEGTVDMNIFPISVSNRVVEVSLFLLVYCIPTSGKIFEGHRVLKPGDRNLWGRLQLSMPTVLAGMDKPLSWGECLAAFASRSGAHYCV